MKYDKETTDLIVEQYKSGVSVTDIAQMIDVPERSIIAKLASLGIYQRKAYTNKRGEAPIKKEVYLERIAELLNVNIDLLDSLDKVNKNVLILISESLSKRISEE